jgi:hypothetical protein
MRRSDRRAAAGLSRLGSNEGELRLITTLTSFATAVDVTLSELHLEAFLPAPGIGSRFATGCGDDQSPEEVAPADAVLWALVRGQVAVDELEHRAAAVGAQHDFDRRRTRWQDVAAGGDLKTSVEEWVQGWVASIAR